MNGTQWLVQALINQGVKKIFGYPGGAIMPVYDALYDSDLEHLLCRHEQGAVMAVIGYARVSNKPEVCLATSGPEATNLITGLADALLDSVPIVAITGQVAMELIWTDVFQEVDVLSFSFACTKHSFLVDCVEMLPQVVTEAFSIATTGCPGPVLIDIPKDIHLQPIHVHPYCMPAKQKTFYSTHQLVIACEIMEQAKQPILYVGGVVGMSVAVSELRNFVAISGLPTVSTLNGLGAVTADDPHYLGLMMHWIGYSVM